MVKVAAICMNSIPHPEKNLETATRLVREAAASGNDWVMLPEVFPYMGPDTTTYEVYEKISQPTWESMSALAKELGIVLIAGTIPRPDPSTKKLANIMPIFNRDGSLLIEYHKTHLFELVSAEGDVQVTERKLYSAGDRCRSLEIDGLHVGLGICYDIRFANYFSKLGEERPLDVIFLPAAFTQETGSAHWHLLLRARALDNQCYVIGSTQTGNHFAQRYSYGHALIVDPWARVLGDSGPEEGFISSVIEPRLIAESRARLQQKAHRRLDLYGK